MDQAGPGQRVAARFGAVYARVRAIERRFGPLSGVFILRFLGFLYADPPEPSSTVPDGGLTPLDPATPLA